MNGVDLNVPSLCFTIMVSLTPDLTACSSKELQSTWPDYTQDLKKNILIFLNCY